MPLDLIEQLDVASTTTSQATQVAGRPTLLDRITTLLDRPLLTIALIGFVAFLLYSRSLSFEFVWDDHVQITHNPLIRSWTALHGIFNHHFGFQQTNEIRYYRPLLNVWSILVFKLFNLRPSGWHLMTVLLHAAASISVYSMARLLKFKIPAAFFAALLFAVHPVHIESVCWVSGGGDSMVTLFCVLSFIAFYKGRQTPGPARWGWLISSWVLLLLGLWTKEAAISFSAVIFTFAWTHPQPEDKSRMRSAVFITLPYVAVTLAYLLGRKVALQHVVQFNSEIGFVQVLVTLPTVVVRDLRLLAWPVGLNGLYYVPYVTEPGISNFLLPLVLLAGIVVLFSYWVRKRQDQDVVFLALWIPITLLPTFYLPVLCDSGFVRDRYLYLPSVAFVFLIVKLLQLLPWRKPAVGIAAVLIVLGIAGTLGQQMQWANYRVLFERGFRLNPKSWLGVNYAIALTNRREYARAKDVLESEMVPLYGDDGAVSNALAICYGRLGELTKGNLELQKALDTEAGDDSAGVKTNLAMAYEALNQYRSALLLLQDALHKSPEFLPAITETGYVYERMGDLPEAENWYRRSLTLDPYDSDSLFRYGSLLIARGQTLEGEERILRAIELGPVARGYHEELAKSLAARGEKSQAIAELKKELETSPGNKGAQQLMIGLI